MVSARLSFLTTAWGTEDLIGATIASVQAQTCGAWELVIVDNGESAAMAEVVGRHTANDPRIRLVRQPNRGYRGGVMAAAAVAVGEFVCVLDSDDLLLPRFVERVLATFDAEPAVHAVGVDAHRFSEPDVAVNLPVDYMASIGVRHMPSPATSLTLVDVLSGCVPYYCAAIRRPAWDAVEGYDPQGTGMADVDESVIIWCRLVRDFDVRLLPDVLARYRLRSDSLSRDPAGVERFENELMRSFQAGAGTSLSADEAAALESTLRRLRYQQQIRRSRHALLDGDAVAAKNAAREAFRLRRTARAGTIYAGLCVAPGALTRIHPAKQAITARTEVALGRLRKSSA